MVNLTWVGDRVLNENELALVDNALVCYEQQLRVDERDARMAAAENENYPEVRDSLSRLAETHAETSRRVNRLLEVIG